MKPKLFTALLLTWILICMDTLVFGQSTRQQAIWYGYFLTVPITEKWYTMTEIQERHLVGPIQQNQFLIRTRLQRKLGENWEGGTGFSLFLHHRNGSSENDDFNWPEIRPHLESTFKTKLNRVMLEQRIRGEARFFQNFDSESESLTEGFQFRAFRARYRLQATFPIAKIQGEKALKLKIANEIMGMGAGEIGAFTFDQNRISSDFSLELSPKIQLEIGYVYWHQALNSGGFLNQHIIRTYLRHTLSSKEKGRKTGLSD